MVLRLDSARPLVWRTPSSLQVGVEPPAIVLDDLSHDDEMMIEVLRSGVTPAMLARAVAANGWGRTRVDDLLDRLAPVLEGSAAGPLAGLGIALDGDPRDASALRDLLVALGAEVSTAQGGSGPIVPDSAGSERTGLGPRPPRREQEIGGAPEAVAERHPRRRAAVVLSHYVVHPRSAARWLRADVPHLLVRFGDRSIRVGPLVSPGRGPCATCLELAHTDRDAAWPAMCAQLARRRAPTADACGWAVLGPIVARILGSSDEAWSTRVVRLPRLTEREPHDEWMEELDPVRPHPRCGCLSPQGNATAPAHPTDEIRPPPTRATAAPRPG